MCLIGVADMLFFLTCSQSAEHGFQTRYALNIVSSNSIARMPALIAMRGSWMAFKGRYFMMTPGKRLHTRRGGGWVVRGGDTCVALAGGGTRAQGQDEGDASVPTNVTICTPKYIPLKRATM